MSEVPEPATPVTRTYLRYLLSFGVWFVAGLAPLLGKVKVPGFSALIEMYPADLQDWLIPLSGFFMGMMAVVVEFASAKTISTSKLTRWFVGTVVLFAVSLGFLLVLYLFVVVRIDKAIVRDANAPPERISLAVVTGTLDVPRQRPGSGCGCLEGQAADQCIGDISLNPTAVRACFGSQRIALATLALAALYLALTGSFAAAVGLLLLSQRRAASEKRRRR